MRQILKRIKCGGLFMAMFMIVCGLLGVCDASALGASATALEGGGSVDTNSATIASDVRERSDKLILDTIDEKVAIIRPYDVPLDTISRNVNDIKTSNNPVVRHYAMDVIDLMTEVTTAITGGSTAAVVLELENNEIVAPDQTLIVNGVQGYMEDGVTVDPNNELMLYIIGLDSTNRPQAIAVNGQKNTSTGQNTTIPAISAGTVITRAGRAGAETQIQTAPYSGVPTDFTQYLQKFMAQVEESTIHKIADKEVDWNFSDQEEEAIFDMKRTQNVSFWKGVKARIKTRNNSVSKAEDIYFTQGIWAQAGSDYSFGNAITPDKIVSLMKASFTGNSSGQKKIFIVGSDILEALEQIEYTKIIKVGERKAAYGIEFSSVVSKFGELLVCHDKSLDDMGWADRGFVLDPNFLRKWTYGWRVEDFDKRKSGERDVDSRALIEICGLVLKNPKAHIRVTLA